MSRKFLTHINLAQNELQNAVIQRLASDPGSPVEGQFWYNTTTDEIKYYDGAAVQTVGTGDGSGDVVGPASSTDSQVALFDSTTGKVIKTASLTADVLKMSSGVLSAAVAGTDYVSDSSTNTLTNKTLDANGAGNSISNLETADFATGVVDTDVTLAANDNTRLASQAAIKAYVDNNLQGLAWKEPVRAATTVNGDLATAFENGDSLDGVTLSTGDRILIKDQSNGAENGIYVVSASGAPTRAADADDGTELVNATVLVSEGTANADVAYTQTVNATITVGSTALAFASISGGSVPVASTTVQGKVELAEASEAEAKSSTILAVTPASLVNFPQKKTFLIGDGSATSIAVNHALSTKDVTYSLREDATDAFVDADATATDANNVTFDFTTAPAANSLRVVIMG